MVVAAYLSWYKLSTQRVFILVIKIRFITYRFLKSTFRLGGRKRSTIAYTNNRLIEYIGFGKVMVPAKSMYADSNSSAYLHGTWLKTKKCQTVILALLCFITPCSQASLSWLHAQYHPQSVDLTGVWWRFVLPQLLNPLKFLAPPVKNMKIRYMV